MKIMKIDFHTHGKISSKLPFNKEEFANKINEAKNEGIKFQRIDADLTDTFKSKTSKKAEKELEEAAEAIGKVMKKALKKDKITIKVEKLKNTN